MLGSNFIVKKYMIKNLPPLNSLRAFVVAAKHKSFTKAAPELGVIPNPTSNPSY